MKINLYYIVSFIVMSIVEVMVEYLNRNGLIDISYSTYIVVFALMCVVIGNITPTNRRFDYIITALAPLSLFCVVFIWSLIEKDDLEMRFNFLKACYDATKFDILNLCAIMAISGFVASFKSIRIFNIIKSNLLKSGEV